MIPVRLGGMTIGRATYEPGWKWSEHVERAAGAKSCAVEHVGMVDDKPYVSIHLMGADAYANAKKSA